MATKRTEQPKIGDFEESVRFLVTAIKIVFREEVTCSINNQALATIIICYPQPDDRPKQTNDAYITAFVPWN